MLRVCPPGMAAVVQHGVPAKSDDAVLATIDGADSIFRPIGSSRRGNELVSRLFGCALLPKTE